MYHQYKVRMVLEQVYAQLSEYLESNDIHDNKTLSDVVVLHNTNFQIVLLTNDAKTLAITKKFDNDSNIDDFINIHLWKKFEENTVLFKNGYLQAWKILPNNYRMYLHLHAHEPSFFNVEHKPILAFLLLLPILLLLLISAKFYLFLKRRHSDWLKIQKHMLNQDTYVTYKPIRVDSEHELNSLLHTLNRINHRLHMQSDVIRSLNKDKLHILEKSPALIFVTDIDKVFTTANQTLLDTFNINHDLLLSLHISNLVQAENPSKQHLFEKLLAGFQEVRILVRSISSQNKYDLFLNPIYDNQNLIGFSGVLHDVNRDQNKIQKMSLVQSDMNERFATNEKLWAMMGHELRTPLSGMLGMMQLLEDTDLDTEQKDYVKTLMSSSNNMLFLLNDMLDLSKIGAGKMESVIERVELLTMCREACELMIGNARSQHLELVFLADLDLPKFVKTDSFRLRQVFLNLLGNAFKFTESGHISFLVHCVDDNADIFYKRFIKSDPLKRWLCFSIADTGLGIPEESQQQLFYFFNQANSSVSHNFGGTGLGLAISKGLVEMLGGFIQLSSEVGKSTTFDVYIPITIEEDNQPIYNNLERFDGEQVYIFESNQLNCTYLQELFHIQGAETTVFTHITIEILHEIFNQHTDSKFKPLLLIDYALLEDNKICASCLEYVDFKKSRKVLMSYHNQRAIPDILLKQFDGFISKPYDIEHMLTELFRLTQLKDVYGISTTTEITTVKPHQIAILPDTTEASQHLNNKTIQLDITVLLVEDNIVNQKITTKLLQKQGCEVFVANNGEVAIEVLKQHADTIDIILMDHHMPKMDGIEATLIMRKLKYTLPIIALTANDSREHHLAYKESGMNDFISKPIQKEKLTSILSEFIVHIKEPPTKTDCGLIEEDPQPSASEVNNKDAVDLKNVTILLAEDNIVNQKIATTFLQKHGCMVITAKNGEIAVKKLQQHADKIDLILMDYRMPKMDGVAATRAIRNLNATLPIIALTANDTEADRLACKLAGMNDFIAKPIKKDTFISVIAQFIPKVTEEK